MLKNGHKIILLAIFWGKIKKSFRNRWKTFFLDNFPRDKVNQIVFRPYFAICGAFLGAYLAILAAVKPRSGNFTTNDRIQMLPFNSPAPSNSNSADLFRHNIPYGSAHHITLWLVPKSLQNYNKIETIAAGTLMINEKKKAQKREFIQVDVWHPFFVWRCDD